jgi:hypothetical protein
VYECRDRKVYKDKGSKGEQKMDSIRIAKKAKKEKEKRNPSIDQFARPVGIEG